MKIQINKRGKKLLLWQNGQCKHTFPIGIGKNAIGTKQRRNDYRTPEGSYQIIVKNPRSQYVLSLGLNYPNPTDAWRGFRAGIITAETCQQICTAHAHGKSIPWQTALGGAIYIHGELEQREWSEGCVRLFNHDIATLYALVQVGDRVEITP